MGTNSRDSLTTGLLLALILACGLILSSGNRVDPDLWGHVRYGADVLAAGHLPRVATHTFTAPRHPWINHENLAEILFAILAGYGGAPGLLLLKTLLGLVVIGVPIRAALRKGASLPVVSIVAVLTAYNVAPGWTVRPQLFTYLFFGFLLALLDLAFEDPRAPAARCHRWAAQCAIPALFVVWANTHGGFVAGLGVLALFLGCHALESLGTPAAAREIAVSTLVLAGSALATLLNPYGTDLLTWLAWDLALPRPEITEWGPLVPSDLQFVPFLLLVGTTAFAWLRSERRRRLSHTVPLAIAVWQSIAHVRHAPLLALMVGFWLPSHLESARRGLRKRPSADVALTSARSVPRPFSTAVWMTVLALSIGLATRTRVLDVNKAEYPVEAVAYMARKGIHGKLVAHFDWTQYAIAALAPPTTLAFDGRFRTCYPQEIADMHFDFILGDAGGRRWRSPDSPPIDGARVLEYETPDLVLLSRQYPHAVETMERNVNDWTLLYQDTLAQLWGRRTRYDEPASENFLAPTERSIGDHPQSGLAPWPALPSPS